MHRHGIPEENERMTPHCKPTDDTLSKVGRWLLAIAVVALAALILWMTGYGDRLPAHGGSAPLHIGQAVT
jgi:hypothetical protein